MIFSVCLKLDIFILFGPYQEYRHHCSGCSRTRQQAGGKLKDLLNVKNSKLPLCFKWSTSPVIYTLGKFLFRRRCWTSLSISSCPPSNKSMPGSTLSVSAHVALCLYISYIYTYCDKINRLATKRISCFLEDKSFCILCLFLQVYYLSCGKC